MIDGKHIEIRPHRAMLVLAEIGADVRGFWPLYHAYSAAEFEADHHCTSDCSARCINPSHLQWLTNEDHREKTRTQRWNR